MEKSFMRANFMTAMLTSLSASSAPFSISSIPRAFNKKGELKKPFQHNPRNNRKTKKVKS